MLIYFLILLKSPSLQETLEAIVSMCPCQFKFESQMTPKYLEKSFTEEMILTSLGQAY